MKIEERHLVSFVIPTYQSALWLPHAVKSALAQTYKEIEVVIVNDCSTDMTSQYLDWLKAQGDKRITIINNTHNLGRSASRNLGNTAASGEVLFVLDADDLASPNRVELSLKKMESSKVQFVYGSATVMDDLGRRVQSSAYPNGEIRADVFNLEKAIDTKLNRIVHSSVAYTKEFAEKYHYELGEVARLGIDDWSQQITAALDGVRFDYVPQTICAYRATASGISRTRNEAEVLEQKNKILATRNVPVSA